MILILEIMFVVRNRKMNWLLSDGNIEVIVCGNRILVKLSNFGRLSVVVVLFCFLLILVSFVWRIFVKYVEKFSDSVRSVCV